MIPGMVPGQSSITLVSPILTEKGGLKQTQKRPRQHQPSTSTPSIPSSQPSTYTPTALPSPSVNHARRSTHNNQQGGGANLQPTATAPGPSNTVQRHLTPELLQQLLKQTQHLCQPVVSATNHTPLPPAKRPKLSPVTSSSHASTTTNTANHSANAGRSHLNNQQARQANLQPTVSQTFVSEPSHTTLSLTTSRNQMPPNTTSTSLFIAQESSHTTSLSPFPSGEANNLKQTQDGRHSSPMMISDSESNSDSDSDSDLVSVPKQFRRPPSTT